MKKQFFQILAFFVLFSSNGDAQNTCTDPSCLSSSLIINTGYNHSTNTVFATNQQDPYWILTDAPTDVVVNLNGPAYVIPSVWAGPSTIDNTNNYISAFGSAGSNKDNTSLSKHPYSFERCFCVCGDNVKVNFDITVRVDNQVKFYLDNVLLPGQPAQLSTTTTYNFDATDDAKNKINASVVLGNGRHCLRVEVRNDGDGSAMGLDIKGLISTSGAKLLKENCCSSSGFIVGYKFKDQNCNGQQDAIDGFLPGWQIQVNGSGLSQTITTDANGYYSFSVPAGTYTVSEVMQNGWSATTPVGGVQSNVVVAPNSVTRINFGNCPLPPSNTCCPELRNLVVNPSFDVKNQPLGFTSQYTYDPGAPAVNSLLTGEQAIINPADAQKICPQWVMKASCPQSFLATNGANNQGAGPKLVWQETISGLKGATEYKFCAKVLNLKTCCFSVTPKLDIKFSIPGNDIIGQSIDDPNLPQVCDLWRQIEKRITVPNGTNSVVIQIFLQENASGDGNDLGLDDIAFVELPQTPKNRTAFSLVPNNPKPSTLGFTATPIDKDLKDCGVWWKVCEYDPTSPDKCKAGTAIENPPQWWVYPNPLSFSGYDYLHPSTLSGTNPGVFSSEKIYRFEMGVFCPCTGWNSTTIIYDAKGKKAISTN